MIRCRKCGRQLKDPGSQLLGIGPYCRGDHDKPSFRRKGPGKGVQPSLFDDVAILTPEIEDAIESHWQADSGEVVDWDRLRGSS